METNGIITRSSNFTVTETVERLVVFLQDHGARVYARIDQQTELERVGISIRPLECLLFGNPAKGGLVIAANPLSALDLPLKIIVWENDTAKTMVSFHDTALIEDRYQIAGELVRALDLNAVVTGALGAE